jgi:hypothetical protein
VVEDVAIAGRPSAAVGQASQAEPLPAAADFGLDHHFAAPPNQKGLSTAVQILHQPHAGVAAIKD